MMVRLLFLLVLVCAPARAEFVLQLPIGAKETYSQVETALPPEVPVGPYGENGLVTVTAEGKIRRSVWAFGGEQTLAEVQKGILEQLKSSDYEVLLFCQTEQCGGFDFRFAIDVVPEPYMRVDLRDFRFISARQGVSETPAYVTFLLSKSPVSVYVQMVEYTPQWETPLESMTLSTPLVVLKPAERPEPSEAADMPSIVLEGLKFESGSAKLGADPLASIAALAELLRKDLKLKVLLVGHSDMSGPLSGNTSLSQKRAETIRDILVDKYKINPERLSAHGVGFLSPRASNETAEGRAKNRRVEVVFFR